MSANIYISAPASTPTILNQDINLNSVLQGQVGFNTPINVNLQDTLGNPVNPIATTLVGNTLTAALNIPQPSGVALQFPSASQYPSFIKGDTGWRVQNSFYFYSPPIYPAKFARLKNTTLNDYFYELETPLSVNGVSSTKRFVDLSGVQSWSLSNNLSVATIDKLTGLMFLRTPISVAPQSFDNAMASAMSYNVTILGNTYSDWYCMGKGEADAIYSGFATGGNWFDPTSLGVVIASLPALPNSLLLSDTYLDATTNFHSYSFASNGFRTAAITSKNNTNNHFAVYIHDARNLIS